MSIFKFKISIIIAIALTIVLLGVPFGCSAPVPSLAMTAPSGNAFAIGDVAVSVDVSNFKIVDKQGQKPVKGEGHLHYFMDVTAPTTEGKPAVTEPGTYSHEVTKTYTWHNVGGGSHTFSVELVNNDHTPLNPPVVITKTILVIPEIGLPQAVILTPRDGAVLPAGDITIKTQVSNFNLVALLSQPNAAREGHLIYFIDAGTPPVGIATAQDSYTWANVKAGVHTFVIELVNNDHTPLNPRVFATINVTVQ